MKVASKPISSPSRAEKFPPPLMRFLRSNVGNKSRGRSRSSPMFVRKKNAAVIETQEPSSPKVTCIGQVRVRRSSKHSKSGRSRPSPAKCPPFWVPRKPKFGSFRPVWRRWVSFFRFGHRKKVIVREDSSNVEPNRRSHLNESETEENEENGDEDEEGQGEEVFVSTTPPKNAFLLTRCRSAPYRSSSLASRFWAQETEEGRNVTNEKCGSEEQGREIERPPISDIEPNSKISVDSEDILGNSEQSEGLISGRNSEGSNQEMKEKAVLPLVLTRCKSEPARTGERLLINPENHPFLEPNKVEFC